MQPDFLENIPVIFQYGLVVVLGLLLGSFSTALTHRVPRGISWAFDKSSARSSCPSCKSKLGVFDLIPIFSWLCSKGQCRHCHASIGAIYPLIELSVSLMVLLAFCRFGFASEFFWLTAAIPFLVALLAIDLRTLTLPNQLIYVLLGLGLLRALQYSFIASDAGLELFLGYVLAAVVFSGTVWIIGFFVGRALGKKALGMGDVKFFAVAGLWLGAGGSPYLYNFAYFLIVSGLLGVAFSVLWKKFKGDRLFPFGPALISAFYVLLLVGSSQLAEFNLH